MSTRDKIAQLRHFSADEESFWPAYLSVCAELVDAQSGLLYQRHEDSWILKFRAESKNLDAVQGEIARSVMRHICDKCLADKQVQARIEETGQTVLAVSLDDISPPAVALFVAAGKPNGQAREQMEKLQLMSTSLALFQLQRRADGLTTEVTNLRGILDILLLLNAEERFVAACMRLVNEVAGRYNCARVSLGWLDDGYIKLQAISEMQKFDRKMEIVDQLEALMEECLEQDEEVLFPAADNSLTVIRDHQAYANRQQAGYLLSLPLRTGQEPVAVMTCESDCPFTQQEIRSLRILCDQVGRRLAAVKNTDKWLGALVNDRLCAWSAKLVGVEHTMLKLTALCCALLLILSMIVTLPYRVEAPFMLRSKDVQQVASPVESYIQDVHVAIGQQVKKDQLLLTLDNKDLLLEEAAATANQLRFLGEAEKARAGGSPIEMKIAHAKADQAKAQLDLIRYRLAQTELRSLIDGIIVEGELEELLGAPVSRGDILFKVARYDHLFVEISIDERDIHNLETGQPGSLTFVSRPEEKYPLLVTRIDPLALTRDSGNVFLARAEPESTAAWWRPGMSGIARIRIENRSILWLLSHRTLEFFQMLVWW